MYAAPLQALRNMYTTNERIPTISACAQLVSPGGCINLEF